MNPEHTLVFLLSPSKTFKLLYDKYILQLLDKFAFPKTTVYKYSVYIYAVKKIYIYPKISLKK